MSANNPGAVGHFQHVGHVSGGTGVEDGDVDVVVDEIENGGHEMARVERDSLAGFEIDLYVVIVCEFFKERDQAVDVVAGASDVMAAAEVNPLDVGQEVSEFFDECVSGAFERVEATFAEGVKVQAG